MLRFVLFFYKTTLLYFTNNFCITIFLKSPVLAAAPDMLYNYSLFLFKLHIPKIINVNKLSTFNTIQNISCIYCFLKAFLYLTIMLKTFHNNSILLYLYCIYISVSDFCSVCFSLEYTNHFTYFNILYILFFYLKSPVLAAAPDIPQCAFHHIPSTP